MGIHIDRLYSTLFVILCGSLLPSSLLSPKLARQRWRASNRPPSFGCRSA